MLKEIQKILVYTLILIVSYDTIELCLNYLNPKKENELSIVTREVERAEHFIQKATPYEALSFPIWPIVICFSCAFFYVLSRFLRSEKFKFLRKQPANTHPTPVSMQTYRITEMHQEMPKNAYSKSKDWTETVHLKSRVNQFETKMTCEDKHPQCNDRKIEKNHLPQRVVNDGKFVKKENEDHLLPASNTKLWEPSLWEAEMISIPSVYNIFNVDNLSPSTTNLLHFDSKFSQSSKVVCDVILENRKLGKLESIMSGNLSVDEKKHCSLKMKNEGECIEKNNCIEDEISDESIIDEDTMIQHNNNKAIKFRNDNIEDKLTEMLSDKHGLAKLLTYTDCDIKKIEKRLDSIEYCVKRVEDKTNTLSTRFNYTETELVDLHEQMYSLLDKVEDAKNSNLIIVSQAPDMPDKGKSVSMNKSREIIKNVQEGKYQGKIEDSYTNVNEVNDISNINEMESLLRKTQGSNLYMTDIKKKSVAMEAMLERAPQFSTNSYNPRKISTSCKVPTHVVAPHRRSSFTCTDSKAELVKNKRRYKTDCIRDIFKQKAR